MKVSNKFQKVKLKPIKLKQLLFETKLKLEIKNNKIITERQSIKSRNIKDNINYNNIFLNTLNSTNLSNKNKTAINLKYNTPFNKSNKQGINKVPLNTKANKERKKISLNLDKGCTIYFKKLANKKYQKMKYLLIKERIKMLSLPKYKHVNNFENEKISNKIKKNNNHINKKDNYHQHFQNYKYKKYDNYLFEKEKLKSRKRIDDILKTSFKKLDSCELKFKTIIDRNMKFLSDYQHNTFVNLKKEK